MWSGGGGGGTREGGSVVKGEYLFGPKFTQIVLSSASSLLPPLPASRLSDPTSASRRKPPKGREGIRQGIEDIEGSEEKWVAQLLRPGENRPQRRKRRIKLSRKRFAGTALLDGQSNILHHSPFAGFTRLGME